MNSIFSILYIAIQERLKTISDIKFIDAEYGQLEDHNGDNRPPVAWPCVLIDVSDTTFADVGSNAQVAMAKVMLRIGFAPRSSSGSFTPAQYRNKALYHYELEDMIHRKLHGWTPGTVAISNTKSVDANNIFGTLTRTEASTEDRSDLIRVRTLTYTIGIDDYSATPAIITAENVNAGLDVYLDEE